MADAYNSTSQLANLFQDAFDRNMRLALRGMPQFRAFADVKPVNQTNPGGSVAFTIYSDLTEVTSALDEIVDPDSVALPNPSQVSVTLVERGNYTVTTALAKLFTIDPKMLENIANVVAYNQAASIDTVVQNVLAAGTQVIRENGGATVIGGTNGAVVGTDTLKSRDIRLAITSLRSDNVVPVRQDYYAVNLHPQASHDLRAETGAGSWRQPKEYAEPADLYAGEIGNWEGGIFVENSRCINTQAGSGSGSSQVRLFNTYIHGKEALAEAVAEEPHVVLDGTIVDPLKRKMAVGWYGVLGHALLRTKALWVVKTASTARPTV